MDHLVALGADAPWLVAGAVVALVVVLALLRIVVGVAIAAAGLVGLSILIGDAALALVAFAGIGLAIALVVRPRITVGVLLAAAILPFAAEALRSVPALADLGFTGKGLADSMLALAIGAVAGLVVRPLFATRRGVGGHFGSGGSGHYGQSGQHSQPAYRQNPVSG